MYSRITPIQTGYSFFLFGPRGAGKSTLLESQLANQAKLWIDLLDPEEEHIFQTRPGELKNRTSNLSPGSLVVIDEVQRAPKILDVVHSLIEKEKLIFALTGSSARKLRRGAANLLAGRAFVSYLYPLTSTELGDDFELKDILHLGSLPKIFDFDEADSKKKYLRAYANTYLKEEIQAEQLVRNVPQFRKFLEVAGQMNGKPLNYTKVGRDIRADHSVISTYFDILEDTLLGFRLMAYNKSIRKQQRQAPKFYFIDEGIRRAIDRTLEIDIKESTYEYGRSFESFFISEIYKLCHYRDRDEKLFYLLTKDDAEIDLIVDRPGKTTLVIEVKATKTVHEVDIKTLKSFAGDIPNAEFYLVSRDPHSKSLDGVECLPWYEFVSGFWHDKL